MATMVEKETKGLARKMFHRVLMENQPLARARRSGCCPTWT